MKKIIIIQSAGLVFIMLLIGVSIWDQSRVSKIENCKVIDLQQQQIITGTNGNMQTQIRYIVITNKETFICQSSLLNGKFNNSDIFWNLKKDSTYSFIVAGVGKSILTEYRNILKIIQP